MASAVPFSNDELYFGSVPIALAKAPGKSIRYEHSQWKLSYSEQDLAKTLSRSEKYLPPGESSDAPPFVIPGIPAREIVPSAEAQEVVEPELLSYPLIKVPLGHADALPVKAVASGVRSGLVKAQDGSCWYRLKGCGNHDQGFVVRTTQAGTDAPAWRDVRGSAFLHTALRECFMAQETLLLFEPQGLPCCNTPAAIFQYGAPHDVLGPERPLACIVEQTRGDRRLGTHVLAGLQLLLPDLVQVSALSEAAALQGPNGWFPAARPRQGEGQEEGAGAVVTTAELMTDMMLAKEMGMEGHGLSWPDVPRDHTTLSFLGGTQLPERGAGGERERRKEEKEEKTEQEKTQSTATLPQQWTAEGAKAMDEGWRVLWERARARFALAAAAAQGRGSSVLGYVYSRVGFDCGRTLRAMHANRMSWGTYQDDMCRRDFGEYHCNAHANNLVLLEAGAEPGAMVGMLDLDMAFTEESFVDIWGSKGRIAPAAFDALLHKEHLNFIEVLAGGDCTSGVPMVGQAAMRAMPKECHELQAALLDTLVLGYLRGYTGDLNYPVVDLDPDLHQGAYAAMEMAVMVMADFIA